MLKFSANLGFLWPERPLCERITAAARAGFRAVEFHWPHDVSAAEVRRTCEVACVRALCLNTPVGNAAAGEYGLAAVESREAEFAQGLDSTIRYARAIAAPMVHVMAGIASSANTRSRAVLASNLRLAAERAPDLTILLEPLNSRDRPGYFYSALEDVAAMIDAVAAPNLRILFDVYHIAITQGDVLTRLERYMPFIGHVQIAAVPSRAEPDRGEIAYRAVFEALDRLGYGGWIGCEYRPRTTTDAGRHWLHDLRVAL